MPKKSANNSFPKFDAVFESPTKPSADFPISVICIAGQEPVVLSRFGDDAWDFSPHIKRANKGATKRLHWHIRNLQASLVESCKVATLAYWKFGAHKSKKRPEATTVASFARHLLTFSEWLQARSIMSFNQIDQDTATAYAAWIRHPERGLKASTQDQRLALLETLFALSDRLEDGLRCHPWPGQSSTTLSGRYKHTRVSGTEIIPLPITQSLFQKAERLFERAEKLLDAREKMQEVAAEAAGLHPTVIGVKKRKMLAELGFKYEFGRGFIHELIELSTACFVVIGMFSGMRSHELSSIEVNAYYETEEDGEVYGWLKGESHKTFEGQTEWMVPPIVGRAVEIQTRIAEPMRALMLEEGREIQDVLGGAGLLEDERKNLVTRAAQIKADSKRIFLGKGKAGIACISSEGWMGRLKTFAKEFSWNLHSHQLRRTFAVFVAQNAMGDLRYLRHHFKHWSLDMTLLYARNEKQDHELYDEMLAEIKERKVSVVEHWLDDSTSLSGGRAKNVLEYRQQREVKTLKDRRALAAVLSNQVSVRSTGHSWCLSDGWGSCGGRGLYEMTSCGGCGEGLVDDSQKDVWHNLHLQQRELLSLDDIGPGGRSRVLRDIQRVEKVLSDLGCDFEPVLETEV